MKPGERQVAPHIGGIRGDHKARYKFAGHMLHHGDRVLDAACGVGYGSKMLADRGSGFKVTGIDNCEEAIAYAKEHYPSPDVYFKCADARWFRSLRGFDAVVSFETIEHVADPDRLVRKFAEQSPRLIASVPNEKILPFDPKRFNHHFRHYTPAEFERLLNHNGFEVTNWFCQTDAGVGTVVEGQEGRTVIVDARRMSRVGVPRDDNLYSFEYNTKPLPRAA